MRHHYSRRMSMSMNVSHWIRTVREIAARDQVSGVPGRCSFCSSPAVSWDYATRVLGGTTVIDATAVCPSHRATRDTRQREVS